MSGTKKPSNHAVRTSYVKGTWVQKLGDYFDSIPDEASLYWKSIVLILVLMSALIFCLIRSEMIFNSDPSILKGEIDLSGKWSISFDNRTDYASLSLDDSKWCSINVPDAGVKTLTNSNKSDECPKSHYPVDLMRNNTYWYRKWIDIPKGYALTKPSLFLGVIKREAWIYWDAQQIGTGTFESLPTILLLEHSQIKEGKHLLAVRVTSTADRFPGIFHALNRKVSIGEYEESVKTIRYLIRDHYLEPFSVLIIQALAFITLLFLIIRSKAGNEKFFWLSIYFGSTSLNSCAAIMAQAWRWFISNAAYTGMACALCGYALTILFPKKPLSYLIKRSILIAGTIAITLEFIGLNLGNPNWLGLGTLDRVFITAALLFILGAFVARLFSKQDDFQLSKFDWTNIVTLLLLNVSYTIERILHFNRAIFIHQPMISSALTLLVIGFAIEEHVQKEKHLAFFGRFIRKGLKQLLLAHEKAALSGEKMFRGRKVIILKIDIIGHTEATYGMPYGMKRIYQDSWFTVVDEIVAQHSFLDKALGDGSFYYLDDRSGRNTASLAMKAARNIRDYGIRRFDELFKSRVDELVRIHPEIREPSEKFNSIYMKRVGSNFQSHQTQVRFVLCAGYVDEGLWGMLSQGHYDVEGDLVTLSARLEKKATVDQMVVNEAFIDKLKSEDPEFSNHFDLEWKTETLKGLGTQKYGLIRNKKPLKKMAA